jgi:hypothetical protein
VETPAIAEFGLPTDAASDNDYTLCLYDASSPTPALVGRFTAPAGATCGSHPCWKPRGPVTRGYLYNDGTATSDGIRSMEATIFQGTRTLLVKGRGAALSAAPLGLPTPPLGLPLRVQLQVRNGSCWEATYSTASHNVAGAFRGRSD